MQAWNAVFAEGRKRNNAAYAGPALIQMEIEHTDKRAAWSFETCCEVWEIQGRAKSRLFFRAVFETCLQTIFSVRENTFIAQLELHQRRANMEFPQGVPVIVASFKREMQKLRSKWNTKLEIANRDSEYQQQQSRDAQHTQRGAPAPSPTLSTSDHQGRRHRTSREGEAAHSSSKPFPPEQIRAAALSFAWRELESRFRQIQVNALAHDRVTADFTRTEWESGSVTEEWVLSGNAVQRAEFERFASIAARKRGYAEREDAVRCWLELIRKWLHTTGLENDKEIVWRPTGEGQTMGSFYKTSHLSTKRIAELSAMFCVEAMADGAPESIVSSPEEKPQIAVPRPQLRSARMQLKMTSKQVQKAGVIFGALQAEYKAQQYCAILDSRNVRLPEGWIEDGCPPTYAQAYREERWRKRIQDEKHRFRRQYDNASPKDREALIQGASTTRRTRR